MVSLVSGTTGTAVNSHIARNERLFSKSSQALGSGKSINKASDNAAGLAVATQLLSDVSTLRQSSSNLLQGISVLQTADGGLQQAGQMLERMKALSVQALSGSVSPSSLSAINTEYQSLLGELGNLAGTTSFNGQKLLDGTYNQDFQAGTAVTDTVSADLSGVNLTPAALGLTPGAGASPGALGSQTAAAATFAELDTAIASISRQRADVGATLSAFTTRGGVVEGTIASNLEAQSAIMDADIAKEQADLTNSRLLLDVSVASAAQANRMKSSLLGLVR